VSSPPLPPSDVPPRSLPVQPAQALRKGYFECRRSQLDMRTRIRGRKFVDSTQQNEQPLLPSLSAGAGGMPGAVGGPGGTAPRGGTA
jgi:hypothetical protein